MDRIMKPQTEHRKPQTEQTGFTLIELIIVIVVVGICFISIMSLFAEGLNKNITNEIRTVATSLAEGKMEEVLQNSFASITNESGSFDVPFSDYSYQVSWNYVESTDLDTPVEGPTEYKNVRVSVSHNLIEDVVLTTLISDYEN